MKAKKKISLALAVLLAISIVFSAPAQVVCAANGRSPFTDVAVTQWYFPYVLEAYNDGVMTGTYHNPATGEREFSPKSPLTMAEWSVMLVRAYYADELAASTVEKLNWYNREVAVLDKHGVYSRLGTVENIVMKTSVTRTQMAVMAANLMKDQGAVASDSEIEAAKGQIKDLDTIPSIYHNAIATCWALGIINGMGDGQFDGGSNMQRSAAAKVYVCMKNKIAELGNGGGEVEPTPPPVTSGLVGTFSSEPIKINASFVETHKPVVDYWSKQPMEIRNIADRDQFNAACQTMKDSKAILTQGEIKMGTNRYYHYAVVPFYTNEAGKNVGQAMSNLSGHNGQYGGYGSAESGYLFYRISPFADAIHTSVAPILAKITPDMSDRQIIELCVRETVARIDYEVSGGASWANGKPTGDCESYARMIQQLLAMADIPVIYMTGTTGLGPHAWLQVGIREGDDITWQIVDGTATEVGHNAILSYAEHQSYMNYDGKINHHDVYAVAKALISAAY